MFSRTVALELSFLLLNSKFLYTIIRTKAQNKTEEENLMKIYKDFVVYWKNSNHFIRRQNLSKCRKIAWFSRGKEKFICVSVCENYKAKENIEKLHC